jgi:hypothetical protein
MKLLRLLLASLLGLGAAGTALATEYTLAAKTGLEHDSNAYLAPRRSYFDPFVDAVVTPQRQAGFFLPLGLDGAVTAGGERLQWVSALDFRGSRHLETELENADSYRTDLSSKARYRLRQQGKRQDWFLFGPTLSYNQEIYVDRDTGLERTTTTSAAALGDRYRYLRYGAEAELRLRTTPVRFTLKGRTSRYDYEEVPRLSSLDHRYYRIDLTTDYDLLPATTLGLDGKYYVRRFEDRPPRDLLGDLDRAAPDRTYRYSGVGLTLEQQVQRQWKLIFAYDQLRREDDFVGYHDYTYQRYQLRSRYRSAEGDLDLRLARWKRDYPRAFAFDDPAFARLSYQAWEGEVKAERPLGGIWSLWARYEFRRQHSSDPRYAYDRHQLALGLQAEL